MYTTSMIRLVSGEDGIATKQVYWTTVGSYVSVQFTLTESTTVQIQSVNVTNDSGGHSADNIQIELDSQATTYEPYNGTTYTIQFTDGSNPLTVYGGYVDIVSGVLTVYKVIRQWTSTDSNTWSKYGTNIFYNTWDNNSYEPSTLGEASETICNTYKGVEKALANLLIGEYCFNSKGISSSKASIAIRNDNFTSGADFKNSLNPPLQLVYPLATPQTYQLTAQQIKSLLGENNVWADTGDVDVHYVRDLTITIDDILSRLEALEG